MLATLSLPLADPVLSRNMYVSKMLRLPLAIMEALVSGADELPKTKFLGYSEHDWTVAQLMLFLDASNGKFKNIPFASQVKFELHSTDGCSDEAGFWVESWYNGELLSFDDHCKDPIRCIYPEFLQMLQAKGFVYTDT